MLRYCENIEQLIGRFGDDYSVFESDLAYRDSVSMNILQIGELASHLSEEYRSTTKERMPWVAMKSMRNFFAHNYGQIDFHIVWATAIENIPEVKKFCLEQIQTHSTNLLEIDEEIDI